jgi:hypothetical protein
MRRMPGIRAWDMTVERARIQVCMTSFRLLAFWVEPRGFQAAPHVNINQFEHSYLNRENAEIGSLSGRWTRRYKSQVNSKSKKVIELERATGIEPA